MRGVQSIKTIKESAINANRVQAEVYGNVKEILKYKDFMATVVNVSADAGVPVGDKRIVKAGTLLGGISVPVLLNPDTKVENKLVAATPASVTTREGELDEIIWTTKATGTAINNKVKIKMVKGDTEATVVEIATAGTGDATVYTITVKLKVDGDSDIIATVGGVIKAIEDHKGAAGAKDASELLYAEPGDGVAKTDLILAEVSTAVPLVGGKNASAADTEGVLLYDIDVTNGAREGSMLIDAVVDLTKIDPDIESVVSSLKSIIPKIIFMK